MQLSQGNWFDNQNIDVCLRLNRFYSDFWIFKSRGISDHPPLPKADNFFWPSCLAIWHKVAFSAWSALMENNGIFQCILGELKTDFYDFIMFLSWMGLLFIYRQLKSVFTKVFKAQHQKGFCRSDFGYRYIIHFPTFSNKKRRKVRPGHESSFY